VTADGARYQVLAPEMVRLELSLASRGARAVAFLVDVAIQIGLLIAAAIAVAFLLPAPGTGGWRVAAWLLVAFLLRTFYFIGFELRMSGRTPAKRMLGLRVVAADGGELDSGMVFARNLTRELEVFAPMLALLAPRVFVPGGKLWLWPVVALWAIVVAALPFLNRRRARLGDLAAGTVVVEEPRARLLPDLVASPLRPASASSAAEQAPPRFSQEQLEMYGIRELHVLEEVLRRHDLVPDQELLATVRRKIEVKIGWQKADQGTWSDIEFLRAFYAAQRGFLERRMVLGERRERKRG